MLFTKQSLIRATPEHVFAFHELPDAFERLMPPWESARIVQTADISKIGSRAIIDITVFGVFTERWVAEHTAYDPPHSFVDTQVSGPFRAWRHTHIVEPHPEGATLRDEIEYRPPLSFIGGLAAPFIIGPKLKRMFAYRHEVTRRWCERGL